MTLGVRPEFVELRICPSSDVPVAARVYTRQVLGNQILYDLIIDHHHVRAISTSKDEFQINDQVFLEFSWPDVFVFCASTEERIRTKEEAK